MRQISSKLTDKNFIKVLNHQSKLIKISKGKKTITFQNALNDLLEKVNN